MKTLTLSRGIFGSAIAIAAALGCTQNVTVIDPPPGNPTPDETSPGSAFGGAQFQAANAPPPVAGGTLLTYVKPDGTRLAIVSDPEEDVIDVASIDALSLVGDPLRLQPGDQPGRLVADAAGRVHVVLRGSGAIATILPTATGATLLARQNVCSAPRGIDYDAQTDSVFVACATGELVQLPAGGGAPTLNVQIDRDLRDVIVSGNQLYITRFRSAEVLKVDRSGSLLARVLPTMPTNLSGSSSQDAAWRATHSPNGGLTMVFQIASNDPIDVAVPPGQSSYGGSVENQQGPPAASVLSVAVTSFGGTSGNATSVLQSNPVVDVAVDPTGGFETVSITGMIETPQSAGFGVDTVSDGTSPNAYIAIADASTATAHTVVVQRRGDVPGLLVVDVDKATVIGSIDLKQAASHLDTGFDIFTMPTSAGIACMNCHPEGGDDSHTWQFLMTEGTRIRRTQSLRGGIISASAPYHWDGDMLDLQALCDEVFTHRMGGGSIGSKQAPILGRFINAMPRIPVSASLDSNRVAAGKTIFEGSGGCISCHTNDGLGTLKVNQSVGKVDRIGMSPSLQVPILLGVADRAPYMHDGCATTLVDRFTNPDCAGKTHGNTASLSADDQTNLIEFLQSL